VLAGHRCRRALIVLDNLLARGPGVEDLAQLGSTYTGYDDPDSRSPTGDAARGASVMRRRAVAMASLPKAGLVVGDSDVVVKALVDPVALTEQVHVTPSTGDRTELGAAWQRAHQRLWLRTA